MELQQIVPGSNREKPPGPPPELAEEISTASRELANYGPLEILDWAAKRFGSRLTMATAFGVEGCLIIHFLAKIAPNVRVFNLDTGYQFLETLDVRQKLLEKYGLEVEYVRPDTTVEEYEKLHGGPLYGVRPDQCCHDRKVLPLRRALAGYSAWISSIRKDQTAQRKEASVVQWDAKFRLVKVNPLLNWDKSAVWKVVLDENVPYNILHDQGFPSIGCQPCTTAVAEGEDERSGRWRGKVKKECGLHVQEHSDGSGI